MLIGKSTAIRSGRKMSVCSLSMVSRYSYGQKSMFIEDRRIDVEIDVIAWDDSVSCTTAFREGISG